MKPTSFLKLGGLVCSTAFLVYCGAENFLGPGKWSVSGTVSCDDADRYSYKIDLLRKRFNRTHEALFIHFLLPGDLDDSIGIRIVVCKFVDGGCKPYRVVTDKSFQHLCERFIAKNLQDILKLAGIDPPSFPVKAGEYKVDQYLFDLDELPETMTYGSYRAVLYLTKNLMDISCIVILAEFDELSE